MPFLRRDRMTNALQQWARPVFKSAPTLVRVGSVRNSNDDPAVDRSNAFLFPAAGVSVHSIAEDLS